MMSLIEDCGAELSADRVYRYSLWRRRFPGQALAVIGLNPSTADERQDDQTIRRCRSYAQQLGCDGGLVMVNLYAVRATDPADAFAHPSPTESAVEPGRNDRAILAACVGAKLVLAAWGGVRQGNRPNLRAFVVSRMLAANGVQLHVLGLTKSGAPRHPSRAPDGLIPFAWNPS